jgi:glycosyltransferase involved in cell wall biosynthesis
LALAGQVRLMEATDARTPVVASDVEALAGYAANRVTARLVPPGDPEALRDAVDGLLEAPRERERLTAAATERAREWTYREYFTAVGELIDDSL